MVLDVYISTGDATFNVSPDDGTVIDVKISTDYMTSYDRTSLKEEVLDNVYDSIQVSTIAEAKSYLNL